MTQLMDLRAKVLDREALANGADWLVVAVAVSLPWSTTATGILIALWLIAVVPTLSGNLVRREVASAAGGLPVLLWVIAAIGMAWASWTEVTWHERLGGLDGFHRLLAIPILLAQFRRSAHGIWVLHGYLGSVAALLLASFTLVLFPDLPWHTPTYGVPVKDYIFQSEQFLICTVVLLAFACTDIRAGRWATAMALIALATLFTVNILFVTTGRTTLLVIPVLALLLAWRELRWKGVLGAVLTAAIIVPAAWFASPYLRQRLQTSLHDYQVYLTADDLSSTAEHLEFIRKSISFVETAPLIGHGTGSIPQQFRNSVAGQTGVASLASDNPHNQILTVAVQLGLLGASVLLAMWAAHLMLFRGAGLTNWIGLVMVVQNVVASLFNSHLFDFGEGWLYVFGVGVVGGMVLHARDPAHKANALKLARTHDP
ncbi:MAG TPA: O-antigen ligase family protein [Xanthobacteraceae bacterium]|nr:O-antigen ligase family protein [Xanthobacteraceae bacterium]